MITDGPVLRIIDDETRDRVQSIKSRYTSQLGNNRQTTKPVLTSLVMCGCCGGFMTINKRERNCLTDHPPRLTISRNETPVRHWLRDPPYTPVWRRLASCRWCQNKI